MRYRYISLLLSLLCCFYIFGEQFLFEQVEIEHNKIRVVPHVKIQEKFLKSSIFWIEYDAHINLDNMDESVALAPIILCLLPLIWVSQEQFIIQKMDKDLFDSIHTIHQVFRLFYPQVTWSGSLVPQQLIHNRLNKKKGAVVLFSHGLDAVCTSYLHLNERQTLCTISGCDISLSKHGMWKNVQKQCVEFAQRFNFDTAFVSFNFRQILDTQKLKNSCPQIRRWWKATLGSLSHAGLVYPVAYALQKKKIYVGASFTRDYPFPAGNHPLIDNALKCAGISVYHDGAQFNRPQKIEYICKKSKKVQVPLPLLRVCWGKTLDGSNCCNCEKCLRTINALIVLNKNPQEFGFEISVPELQQRTDAFFKRKLFQYDLVIDWEHVRSAIPSVLKNYSQEYKDYLSWLQGYPLPISTKKPTIEEQILYNHLWEYALARNIQEVFNCSPLPQSKRSAIGF